MYRRSICKSKFSLTSKRMLMVIILNFCNVIINVPKSFFFFLNALQVLIVFLDVLNNVCADASLRTCTVPGMTCYELHDASPRRGKYKNNVENYKPTLYITCNICSILQHPFQLSLVLVEFKV